jgi:flavin-dependent dehydrogenase
MWPRPCTTVDSDWVKHEKSLRKRFVPRIEAAKFSSVEELSARDRTDAMTKTTVSIAGAGLSGLTAALAVVQQGGQARVLERRGEVGARFHGDFQGLENWSTQRDVLEELTSLGIVPTFEHTPFRECVFFDPEGREHVCRSVDPLWYLVRRGTDAGTLDQALKIQALAAGVDIEFGRAVEHLPDGGIVAHGPRRADAIAVGYVFPTDRSDGAFAAVSDELAPAGYAYLLICRGQATLATCMFADFHNEKEYLHRSVGFFQRQVGIALRDERPFGGFGNMSAEPAVRRGTRLFVGEAAGLQDALFGFGMRFALTSGHLAGTAYACQNLGEYEVAYRRHIRPWIHAAAVNRYAYGRAGATGYRALVGRVCGAPDPRAWLRRHYAPHWWTPLALPLARRDARRRRASAAVDECREHCDCTYCRCLGHATSHARHNALTGTADRPTQALPH